MLSINLGKENAGYTASLYYNQGTGGLEFICADEVAEDGTASFAFTHASDYVIVIDADEEESDPVTEPAQPEDQDKNSSEVTDESPKSGQEETETADESPKTGQEENVPWPIVTGIIALIGIIFTAVPVWKKKEENGSN